MKKSAFRYLFVTVAGLTAALLPINILAAPGDLFETDQGSSTIFKFTPAGAKSTFASGLSQPSGLAFEQPPAAYDFNQDSKPDYVLYNAVTHQTVVWYLDNNVFIEIGRASCRIET